MKIASISFAIVLVLGKLSFAADISNNGNITATFGHNVTASGVLISNTSLSVGTSASIGSSLYSGYYIQAAQFLYAGTYVEGVGYVYSPGYVLSPTGMFTNLLETGGSTATGNLSTALGFNAKSTAYSSVVIGQNNYTLADDGVSACSTTSWVGRDQLFVVGNGNGISGDPNQYGNALAVYKDGTVTMSKAQGDVSMGQFGN